jgi:UDP-xylose/UDP-N-acetylglucosamine transporter B4
MILGVIILKKKYNLREYLSILMITIGIFICTYFSADQIGKHDKTSLPTANENDLSEHFWWVVGNTYFSNPFFY